ncbi:helix-turn-helix domain-containing protein [Mycobacterium sp. C31M]
MSVHCGVSTGQAAALFGLAPSTLRWWEAQGVLPEPPRVNGRRVYAETDLRRIGLAYLCCVTGAMPLEKAAMVTSGTGERDWQDVVQRHVTALETRIGQLQAAHDYLLHLVQCPDADIVTNCPYLDNELSTHTPRRSSAPGALVAAAHSLSPGRHRRRDENTSYGDEITVAGPCCVVCASPVPRTDRGRPRTYCSRACQQRQYRQRMRTASDDR